MAAATRKLCDLDLDAFFFIPLYLKTACFKMAKEGKSVIQISEQCMTTLKMLRKEYPPAPSLQRSLATRKIGSESS